MRNGPEAPSPPRLLVFVVPLHIHVLATSHQGPSAPPTTDPAPRPPDALQADITLIDYLSDLAVARARTAALRDPDCLQSDPLTVPVSELCFTLCSFRAYRDDFSANFSRIAPVPLPRGGYDMMRWIVANRAWLERVQSGLPETVTLVSVRIGGVCNVDAPQHHLAGVLWRVWLLDGTTMAELPGATEYSIAMPIPSDPATQDCVRKDHGEGPQGGGVQPFLRNS